MSTANLFIGHGSRDPEGIAEFLHLVGLCREHKPGAIVEHGFLELAGPTVLEGVERCVARGATSIHVLPGILLESGHARNDVPAEVERARRRFPDVEFRLGRHLHLHPRILDLCQLRIEQATLGQDALPEKTHLLVVGRGSSEMAANEDVGGLAAILVERMRLAGGSACFIDLARPLLAEALAACACSEMSRVIVLSFLLFTGILEKRIRRLTSDFATAHARPETIYAGYLNAHSLLLDAFLERGL